MSQELAVVEDTVNYMMPYMRDEYPMAPEVAQFLQSEPDWNTILHIQKWMVDNKMTDGLEEPLHFLSDGTYTRALPIKGGQFVVGKRHRKGHVTILVRGDATIITEQGQERVRGPRIWVDEPGVKRALYTHADCIFVTVHATNATTLEDIEADLIIPEPIEENVE